MYFHLIMFLLVNLSLQLRDYIKILESTGEISFFRELDILVASLLLCLPYLHPLLTSADPARLNVFRQPKAVKQRTSLGRIKGHVGYWALKKCQHNSMTLWLPLAKTHRGK